MQEVIPSVPMPVENVMRSIGDRVANGAAQDRSAADRVGGALVILRSLTSAIEFRSSTEEELICSRGRRRSGSSDLRGGGGFACPRPRYRRGFRSFSPAPLLCPRAQSPP